VPVPDAHLLLAMGRADARIHIEHDAARRPSTVHEVDPSTRQIGQRRQVRLCRQPMRLEAAHHSRRRLPQKIGACISQIEPAHHSTSAIFPTAAQKRTLSEVRVVPTAVIWQSYSITSSARASSVGGISRPSALAALRLKIVVNLVACSTGMSPGLAPLRILSTKTAARINWSGKCTP
jgi:hypothetical protein